MIQNLRGKGGNSDTGRGEEGLEGAGDAIMKALDQILLRMCEREALSSYSSCYCIHI